MCRRSSDRLNFVMFCSDESVRKGTDLVFRMTLEVCVQGEELKLAVIVAFHFEFCLLVSSLFLVFRSRIFH